MRGREAPILAIAGRMARIDYPGGMKGIERNEGRV